MSTLTDSQLNELPLDASGAPSDESGFGVVTTRHGNLPLTQLAYHCRVVDLCARTTITQTFYNPFDQPIEARYVFPLVGNSAVVGCLMRVQQRNIIAVLKERQQARQDYQQAIARGYRAALLEENRSETFSMQVGNIAPGEAIVTCLETVSTLPVAYGQWTLRLPLVVAPRYTSGLPLPRSAIYPGAQHDTDQVPDASTTVLPILLPGFLSPVHLRVTVDLDLGGLGSQATHDQTSLLQTIKSSLHTVVIDQDRARSTCRVSLRPGEPINRDFILRGDCADRQTACSIVIEEAVTEDPAVAPPATFAVNVVAPKTDNQSPRDIVFLLDRSGSMSGWKMQAAIQGVSSILDTLQAHDRFALLAFDNSVDQYESDAWHPRSFHAADATNIQKAQRWLNTIRSRGGTEMALALHAACECFGNEAATAPKKKTAKPARAIVLVTDGQITGEDSVLKTLASIPESDRPQVFCLGIDRSVNASVLQRIGDFTGGTFELAESNERLQEVLTRFAAEIGHPALSQLTVESADADCQLRDIAGQRPCVYSGRSATLFGRVHRTGLLPQVIVSGVTSDGRMWQQILQPSRVIQPRRPADRLLLPSWARQHLRQLEDRYVTDPVPSSELAKEIVQCSLDSNVLSRMTAYIAVDESEIVNSSGNPHHITQPVNLPEGWDTTVWQRLAPQDLIGIPGQDRSVSPRRTSTSDVADEAIGREVVSRGVVSEEQLLDAQQMANQSNISIAKALAIMGYASAREVAQVTASMHQLAYIDLQSTQIPANVVELIPESVAREYCVIPLHESGGELTVLTANPADLELIEKIQFILNRSVKVMVSAESDIEDAINHYYGQVEGESADSMLQEFTDTAIDFTETLDDESLFDSFGDLPSAPPSMEEHASVTEPHGYFPGFSPAFLSEQGQLDTSLPLPSRAAPSVDPTANAPAVRIVNLILAEAVHLRASHVFLEKQDHVIKVRYLINGKLQDREDVSARMWSAIADRLKILAHLDVCQFDSLQTGEIEITVGDQQQSIHVMVGPSVSDAGILLELLSSGSRRNVTRPQIVTDWIDKWS